MTTTESSSRNNIYKFTVAVQTYDIDEIIRLLKLDKSLINSVFESTSQDKGIMNGYFFKETPLHLAVRFGNLDLCSLLIQNGADINATNLYNETPLHFAIKRHSDIERFLKANKNNENVLNELIKSNHKKEFTPNFIGVFRLLIISGADIRMKDINGKKPFELMKDKDLKLEMLMLKHKPKHKLALSKIVEDERYELAPDIIQKIQENIKGGRNKSRTRKTKRTRKYKKKSKKSKKSKRKKY